MPATFHHNDLFSFSKKEVNAAFKAATLVGRYKGLKLIGCPAPEGQLFGRILIVTPRASGKAHDRNQLRRRVKAIFYQEQLYKKPHTWILLCTKQGVGLTFDQLKAFLLKTIH